MSPTKHRLLAILLLIALAALLALPAFFLSGCTTEELLTAARVADRALISYDEERHPRYGVPNRYPDRPVNPPGAPFPVYPTSP